MRAFLKPVLLAAVLFVSATPSLAKDPMVQHFKIWGSLETPRDKLNFLVGFTNGLFVYGADVIAYKPERKPVFQCILLNESLDYEQAIAMVDKYYKEHPEKWDESVGDGIIDALTVNGGPCAAASLK